MDTSMNTNHDIWIRVHWPESQIYMDKEKYPLTVTHYQDATMVDIEVGSVLIPIEYMNTNNAKIMLNVYKQLKKGEISYKTDVPLDGSRNHIKDALEESIDLAVYVSARLIEINEEEKKENDKNTKKTSQEEADNK